MSSLAIVFPGQGCQFVGMATELCAHFARARERFAQADDILGLPLSRLCAEGPAEELNDTANTQPAIYTGSVILWEALAERLDGARGRIAFVAGHSLGEYAALTAAGALEFEQGLRLVRERGLAMRDAGCFAPGGMAALIGLSDEAVQELISEAQAEGLHVWPANYNSPGQVVIAGSNEGLARAMELAQARGAKRTIPLAVSVACHTPLMDTAVERLAAALAQTELRAPWVPVVSNATATALQTPEEIRAALLRQLAAPVRWVESVRAMVAAGAATMLEVGPKSVVAGLIRRIDEQVNVLAVTDGPSLAATAKALVEVAPA